MHKTYSTVFYEHAAILVPGGTLLASTMALLPTHSPISLSDMSPPNLVVFLLLAYACGNILQILGAMLEGYWWKGRGGMPIDWVRQADKQLLSKEQTSALAGQVQAKLGVNLEKGLTGLSKGQWYFLTRQILGYLKKQGSSAQLQHFTGNYELNRGLAASALVLGMVLLIRNPMAMLSFENYDMLYAAISLCIGTLALYHMERFAVQYALELFSQFMQSPASTEASATVPAATTSAVS